MKEQIKDIKDSDYFSQTDFLFYNNYLIYWHESGYYPSDSKDYFTVFPSDLTLFDVKRVGL